MKTQTSVILSIPQPCHQSWNEMTPADKGRFCQSCQKTVTDFSTLSDSQFIDLLKNKQTSACGRFTASQLNRVISDPVPDKRRKPFVSIAAIVAALTITIPAVQAAAAPNKVEQTTDKEDKPTTGNVSLEDSTSFISGVVKEGRDNLPLPSATVRIKDTNIGTVTDQSGQFKLRIPDDFKKKVMILEIRFVGYEIKTVKVDLKKAIRPISIQLTEDTTMLGKFGIRFITDDKKELSLWEKLRGRVKEIFS
ncbi:carboxypeptidase-like regulatory domain-containing protein [Chitinophaga filiformis]|uniref:CarboxypepD_reg-like domain-containing protein n=1 Tax=Chitinophaga filiformis TaxID=104663 RepID=A0A1G7U8P3_CHIFI|nr:carboxypeptidase-like regulatory domain-containing protein [Chitinophaga filiformis]SDG43995.1 CarboxypepD_reg-like domain-containing protein [Chitinophaga filiformis]